MDFDQREFQTIVLGALLHDIGKFKQRANLADDAGKAHTDIGYEWLASQYGEGGIAAGARNHHGNEPETWLSNISLIFYEADNCAASERKTEFDPKKDIGKDWHRKIQLVNVFSRVRNPHVEEFKMNEPANSPLPSYNPLVKLGGWVVPELNTGENSPENYKHLWEDFEREFLKTKSAGNHCNVDVVLHLLEKYTSFIPSITLKIYGDTDEATYKKHPDVSLFDHLKITAAVATSFYFYLRYHNRAKWHKQIFLKEEIVGNKRMDISYQPFLLIGGDLSGVQKFIYTISSKGALKLLKGRSFFLELLTEHVVSRLLDETKLTVCNVIFTGGGHFYVIAPNTPDSISAVNNIKKEINDYLFDAFNRALNQVIDVVPFSKSDFKDASVIWSNLSAKLENLKKRKWESRLGDILSEPSMPDKDCLTVSCEICGREDKALQQLSDDKPEINACGPCKDQYTLGHLLQKVFKKGAKTLICRWDEKPNTDDVIKIGNHYYQPISALSLCQNEDLLKKANAVYHLNDWELGHYIYPKSRPLLSSTYLPDEQRLWELEGMAKYGFGIGRLAGLRMDVDRLGRIFSSSIPEGERTLSIMASLSRQLSLFFKFHINGIIEGRKGYPGRYFVADTDTKRKLSIVYAGGDDLFLIGHWLDITETSFDIQGAFQKFTKNPFITISGGIALGYDHDPVYQLADAAGVAEEGAKQKGRKALTLFDTHTFNWKDTEEILQLLTIIKRLCIIGDNQFYLPEGSLSRSVLYRLLLLARTFDEERGWNLPKLAYTFGRFNPEKPYDTSWMGLKNYVMNTNFNPHYLEVAILWALMMMRKGNN